MTITITAPAVRLSRMPRAWPDRIARIGRGVEQCARLASAVLIGAEAVILTLAAVSAWRHTGPEWLAYAALALLTLSTALQPLWWPRLMALAARRGLPTPRHEDSAWFARVSAFWALAIALQLAQAMLVTHGWHLVCR